MGFRFRRSIRIAPGLRVNFGKRGVSLSAGVRGASVTTGSRGTYANIGIPGTGLSYREKIGGGSEQRVTARTQQRCEREYQRLNREYEKLEEVRTRQEALSKVNVKLDKETGVVSFEDAFGGQLSTKELRLLWDQQGNMVLKLLERQAEEINGDVALLTKIHEDTPIPDLEPEYEMIPFDENMPDQPKKPETMPKPEMDILPPLSFFARLFKNRRLAHEKKQQQLNNKYAKAMLAWEEETKKRLDTYQVALQTYEESKKAWDKRKKEYETKEAEKKDEFPKILRTDTNIMNKTLEDALHSLSWPRETLVSYQITDEGHQAWIDIDLPEIEDLPQKVASVAANGKKLNIKNKPSKQLQLEYAMHIHGIMFRLAGTIFATLPSISAAVISGYSQRLDGSTGKMKDDYLLSARIEREKYSEIDFESLNKVNPIDAIGSFEIRRKITSNGYFKPITPFEPEGV